MSTIKLEMTIKNIIKKYPETLPIFSLSGFNADSEDQLIAQVGEHTMLKTILNVMQLNKSIFLCMLEEKIQCKCNNIQTINTSHLNFFGNVDCPLKRNFKEMMEEELKKNYSENFNYLIPEICRGNTRYDNILKADNIDKMPDVCLSGGFGDFFKSDFVNNFVDKGYFEAVLPKKIDKAFEDAGCIDPKGYYTMYAANPFVIVVNKNKLKNIPIPKKWSDLLKPCYERKIMISGKDKEKVHYILPSYIHKHFGYEGVKKLAKNVNTVLSTAKMAHIAATSNNEDAPIYVMTWLFAKAFPKTEDIEIIWPEDGAIISPLLMLTKKSEISKVKVFTEFLTGESYGKKSVAIFCPVPNLEIDNKLPPNGKLQWIGWDYLRSNNMDVLKKNFQLIFTKEWCKRSIENKLSNNLIAKVV
jgi:ABC-type Fe3+ transport system substrate-binding protein